MDDVRTCIWEVGSDNSVYGPLLTGDVCIACVSWYLVIRIVMVFTEHLCECACE